MTTYSPVSDLTVVSMCIVMLVLLMFSYVRKNRAFRLFLTMIILVLVTAYVNVSYRTLPTALGPDRYGPVYVLHCLYHGLLFLIFLFYTLYICEVTHLERERRRPFVIASAALLCIVVVSDVIETFLGGHVRVTSEGILTQGLNVYIIGNVFWLLLTAILLKTVSDRLYRKVMLGFYGTFAVSFAMQMIQRLCHDSSYTVATFFYPLIAMFYSMHANPYNAESGAVSGNELEDIVQAFYRNKRPFLFMSLCLKSFDEASTSVSDDVQALIRKYGTDTFRDAVLLQVAKGHFVMVAPKDRNPNYEARVRKILEPFEEEYRRLGYDYKIVIGESIDGISEKNEYIGFIGSTQQHMAWNTVRRVDAQDVERFRQYEYVLGELDSIQRKHDLNDPRVLVYCQPVFNIETQQYDTAEALMRLKLDGKIYFPDQFIPVAEEHGFIHVLTEIILNKTCTAIRRLTESGFHISRISVNVSALELKESGFCGDICRIIQENRIPEEKIAIELTESQTEDDFQLMKEKVSELHGQGIKFYLDDFGTGYSNMERIMALPFDIIKFDRSMVLASGENERSRQIVAKLANMFTEMNYCVLYEGIEKESDEVICIDMSASYLQGYKYSRPIPIEELVNYCARLTA